MLSLLLEHLAQSIAIMLVIAMIALRNRIGKRAGAYLLTALILGAVTLVPRIKTARASGTGAARP